MRTSLNILFVFFLMVGSSAGDIINISEKINKKELLNSLNKECKMDGIPEYNDVRFSLAVLQGASMVMNPLPESRLEGKMVSFVQGFTKKDFQIPVSARIVSVVDNAFEFTDERKDEEFSVVVPKYKMVSLRLYEISKDSERIDWIDIPIYIVEMKK